MKKRILSVFLMLILLLSMAIPVSATEPDAPWVVDSAGLLSVEETAELNQKIQILRSELELEIVLVTTYGTGSKNVQQYADDFYDSNGYGYGETYSGILLLIDMESREWYMSTCGDAIYIFTDYGLEQLGQTILPWLSSGYYYDAFDAWLNALPHYVDAFRNQSPIDGYVQPDEYESPYGDEIYYYEENIGIRIHPFPTALVIGLVAAIITILIMRSRMNTAKLQRGAVDYLKDGSFQLRQRSDMFLYSRVSRKARPKQSSGGGSSVHRSSGGRSHGGRGGRF
jgi:uncharacterized protein